METIISYIVKYMNISDRNTFCWTLKIDNIRGKIFSQEIGPDFIFSHKGVLPYSEHSRSENVTRAAFVNFWEKTNYEIVRS